MRISTSITTNFTCTLERAFKTPMLCDVTKVHSGYGAMPHVTHSTEDTTWGRPGGSRKIFMSKSIAFKGGEATIDRVIERIENKYWKIELSDFKLWTAWITKLEGEWATKEINPGNVEVKYTYTIFSKNILVYPFQWLFVKIIWRIYMKHVIENVRNLAYSNAPYLYS